MTSDYLRGRNWSASGPRIVVAIRPVPRAQSIAREKLYPTCFTHCKRSTLMIRPIWQQKPTAYCKWHFIHVRFEHIIQQPEICWAFFQEYWPRKRGVARHAVIHGLVRWWVSTATWGSPCAQYTVLCRFTCPSKWKHVSSLYISSARILCDSNHSQNIARRSIPSPCSSCTKYISYRWNLWPCRYLVFTCLWKYFQVESLLLIFAELLRSW